MIFQIVQNIEDLGLISSKVKPENLAAWLSVRGMAITGKETRTNLRPELQGAPKIAGLTGPMYGGPGVIRYEDHRTYEIMSA